MPFAKQAHNTASGLGPREPLRVVLEFLIKEAMGHTNAKPWVTIRKHLADHGIQMTKGQFQQTILKRTRSGEIFIGSSTEGYFLIEDEGDAQVMQSFYRVRIAAEQFHLDHLQQLMRAQGWQA